MIMCRSWSVLGRKKMQSYDKDYKKQTTAQAIY